MLRPGLPSWLCRRWPSRCVLKVMWASGIALVLLAFFPDLLLGPEQPVRVALRVGWLGGLGREALGPGAGPRRPRGIGAQPLFQERLIEWHRLGGGGRLEAGGRPRAVELLADLGLPRLELLH